MEDLTRATCGHLPDAFDLLARAYAEAAHLNETYSDPSAVRTLLSTLPICELTPLRLILWKALSRPMPSLPCMGRVAEARPFLPSTWRLALRWGAPFSVGLSYAAQSCMWLLKDKLV